MAVLLEMMERTFGGIDRDMREVGAAKTSPATAIRLLAIATARKSGRQK
jgi:hypothetical protein